MSSDKVEEAFKNKINKSTWYRTRSGLPIRIYEINEERQDFPVHGAIRYSAGWEIHSWNIYGKALDNKIEDQNDLVEVTDKTAKLKCPACGNTELSKLFISRVMSVSHAINNVVHNAIVSDGTVPAVGMPTKEETYKLHCRYTYEDECCNHQFELPVDLRVDLQTLEILFNE